MMLPMERSEVFKILSDIFRQKDNMNKTPLGNITMSESVGYPYDIDFRCEYTGTMVGYLRIVNPPEDCVDGEYCFVYRVPKTQEGGNIAIDAFGNIRVYGDIPQSFTYRAIRDNANRLADYAKKLTQTYQNQVADTIVSIVKTYCETLMNEHASTFDQLDILVSEGCCDEITEFLIRSINEPERNFQFDVMKHIYECDISHNNIRIRFSKPGEWRWTPIDIRPSIGNIIINNNQCVFTDIFGAKEVVRLARLISEQTGFAISVRDGGSTRDKNIAKYIKSLLQKHEVIDTVKQVSTEKVNDENNKTFEQLIDSTIDKKITQLCDIAKRSAYYTTKEYQYSNICKQLTLWQQGIFHMIYSAIYCTLAESKYTGAAFELEHRFMELVGTDKDLGFHVYIRLDNIHKDLPRFDIKFIQSDAYVRINEGDFTKTCVLLNRETDHTKVYTQNIKYMRDTYKTIVSHVASKIVLMEGLRSAIV